MTQALLFCPANDESAWLSWSPSTGINVVIIWALARPCPGHDTGFQETSVLPKPNAFLRARDVHISRNWHDPFASRGETAKCAAMTDELKPMYLGAQSALPQTPEEAALDYVPNPRPDTLYLARFAVPEFTSLCPVTAQPDFAHLVIDYAPDKSIVESKSLKLFLGSFRNHAAFHEDCTVGIGQRLFTEMKPHWLRIGGYWYPRGGIPIDVFWQSGEPPKGLWLPDQGVAPYRGRG